MFFEFEIFSFCNFSFWFFVIISFEKVKKTREVTINLVLA